MPEPPPTSDPAERPDPAAGVQPVRRPRRSARRSRRRRIVGVVAIVVALVVGFFGAGAVWGLWSFSRIKRVDVELAEATASEPRNYLVVGSDSRDGIDPDDPDADGMLGAEAPSGQRADSIMIARVDPGYERVDLLSVPRDLWVPISPSGEEQRINTAYSISAQAVVDTVEDNLGIPIHHFVEVDFRGFQSLIDALGGVPMYFEQPVRDRNSGLAIHEPGCAVLDGGQGLAFARARHLQWKEDGEWHSDPTGDLGRATRQQLLTRAALSRAQHMGIGDVTKLRSLVDAGVGAVTLDSTLGAADLVGLGSQLSDIPPERMQTHGLPVTPSRTGGGAAVVLLDLDRADPVLQIFRGDTSAAPVTTTTAPPPTPGSVTVQVFNGSGVEGEARRVSYVLADGGFATGTVDSVEPTARTTVVHPPGAEQMARLVAAWIRPEARLVEDDSLPPATVSVIIGADFAAVFDPGEEATTTTTTAAPAVADGDGGASPEALPVETTTTTTQPGWVPTSPPAGVSCP